MKDLIGTETKHGNISTPPPYIVNIMDFTRWKCNILLLAATRKTHEEATAAGRDPQYITQSELYNEQVIEIEPQGNNGGNIVGMECAGSFIQDLDSYKRKLWYHFLKPSINQY